MFNLLSSNSSIYPSWKIKLRLANDRENSTVFLFHNTLCCATVYLKFLLGKVNKWILWCLPNINWYYSTINLFLLSICKKKNLWSNCKITFQQKQECYDISGCLFFIIKIPEFSVGKVIKIIIFFVKSLNYFLACKWHQFHFIQSYHLLEANNTIYRFFFKLYCIRIRAQISNAKNFISR